jgi:hypothetical protein
MTQDYEPLTAILESAFKERHAREQRWGRKLIALHIRGFTIEQLALICRASGASPNNTDDLNAVWWLAASAKRVNHAHRASLISAVIAAITADRASRAPRTA